MEDRGSSGLSHCNTLRLGLTIGDRGERRGIGGLDGCYACINAGLRVEQALHKIDFRWHITLMPVYGSRASTNDLVVFTNEEAEVEVTLTGLRESEDPESVLVKAMRSAFALKRYGGGNFRVITGVRKLERATGIEPV